MRWLRRDEREVRSVRAYLVTIVTRLCIDQLGSARAQRVTYTGPWLPEPVTMDDTSTLEQADTLSLAFLVLLEELTPPERAAYLLHDVFGYQFDEVAHAMGRTTAGCRQLASRARHRIEDRRQRFDVDARHGRELTRQFVAACATGDLEGLMGMLADDVVVWTDGGGVVRAAMRPVVGPTRSSRFLVSVARKLHGSPARSLSMANRPWCSWTATGSWPPWRSTSGPAESSGCARSPIPTSWSICGASWRRTRKLSLSLSVMMRPPVDVRRSCT